MVNLTGMGNELWVFFVMSMMVFSGSEITKAWINANGFKPIIKVGLTMAILGGVLFTLGLGHGFAQSLTGIKYSDVLIPELFMGFDILFTGMLLSLGSKGLSKKFEDSGIDISGSIEKKLLDRLKEDKGMDSKSANASVEPKVDFSKINLDQ